MAWYNYECVTCRAQAEQIKGAELTSDEEWEIIYETSHPMEPTTAQLTAALICPKCGGGEAVRTLKGHEPICYVRGNGYLDKAGCYRDMNLHKLVTEDPYAEMREPGEADDLKLRLQRGGQQIIRPRYFTGGSGAADTGAADTGAADNPNDTLPSAAGPD